jgi:hypothetical protein
MDIEEDTVQYFAFNNVIVRTKIVAIVYGTVVL